MVATSVKDSRVHVTSWLATVVDTVGHWARPRVGGSSSLGLHHFKRAQVHDGGGVRHAGDGSSVRLSVGSNMNLGGAKGEEA